MLNIPQDKLPSEWKDEASLDSLFSPFRSRTVNPRDYDTKISAWKHLINIYCVNNGVYSFTLGVLNKLFVRNGRPPSCLAVVVDELVKSGTIQPIEEFLTSQSWSGWFTNILVKKPLAWSYNTLRRSLFTDVKPDIIYAHLEVITTESQKLLALIPGAYKNKLVNLPDFLKMVNKESSQIDDIKLLVHYLTVQRKLDVASLNEATLIKIGHPISETDTTTYLLEQNEKLFIKDVEDLEDQVVSCIAEAKAHLKKGHRQLAKTSLRKKHEIGKRLERKINSLHNIQVLLEKIKDVHGDADVWNSYKHALAAFNNTFKETGLTEDAVEDTMLQLGEVLDIHEDIQAALAKPAQTEELDLEEELAELLQVEEPENNSKSEDDLYDQLAKLDITSLPEIPNAGISQESAVG